MPSDFLSAYLRARARGATVEEASAVSGIGIVEARLHEKDIESGAIRLADYQQEESEVDDQTTISIDIPREEQPAETAHGSNSVAADQLRRFIERIEGLEEEKKDISGDIRDVYSEGKAQGYDPKIMRIMVRLRKMETHTLQEHCALVETYADALGLQGVLPL